MDDSISSPSRSVPVATQDRFRLFPASFIIPVHGDVSGNSPRLSSSSIGIISRLEWRGLRPVFFANFGMTPDGSERLDRGNLPGITNEHSRSHDGWIGIIATGAARGRRNVGECILYILASCFFPHDLVRFRHSSVCPLLSTSGD